MPTAAAAVATSSPWQPSAEPSVTRCLPIAQSVLQHVSCQCHRSRHGRYSSASRSPLCLCLRLAHVAVSLASQASPEFVVHAMYHMAGALEAHHHGLHRHLSLWLLACSLTVRMDEIADEILKLKQ